MRTALYLFAFAWSVLVGCADETQPRQSSPTPLPRVVNTQDSLTGHPNEKTSVRAPLSVPISNNHAASSWVAIGAVSDDDELTQMHIYNLLTKNGIACTVESTVIAEICVRHSQSDRALELIKHDLGSRIYRISLSPGQGYEYEPNEDDWMEQTLRCRYTNFTKSALFANVPLREIFQEGANRYSNISDLYYSYPYIDTIRILQREYIDQDGKIAVGYEYDIELLDSLNVPSMNFRMQGQVIKRDSQTLVLSNRY